jgi:hypothetical protein
MMLPEKLNAEQRQLTSVDERMDPTQDASCTLMHEKITPMENVGHVMFFNTK